jgi:phosphate transport system ATP-binding protein
VVAAGAEPVPSVVAGPAQGAPTLRADGVSAWFGARQVVRDVHLTCPAGSVTAIIGPSGCGKSTLLRCFNRLHETVSGARTAGQVHLDREPLYGAMSDPVAVRRRVGMVFQRATPFPTWSIRANVLAAVRRGAPRPDGLLEEALRRAALWDEVKDRLDADALALSIGQQQRLCIARALAARPEVLLLDEPTAALDPVSTQRIEELVYELRGALTVVIVTHNMQQAARASDHTAFMLGGALVEVAPTGQLFTRPADPRTEAYVTGRFG